LYNIEAIYAIEIIIKLGSKFFNNYIIIKIMNVIIVKYCVSNLKLLVYGNNY